MTNTDFRTLEAVADSTELLSDDDLAVVTGGLSLHDFILPKEPPKKDPPPVLLAK